MTQNGWGDAREEEREYYDPSDIAEAPMMAPVILPPGAPIEPDPHTRIGY